MATVQQHHIKALTPTWLLVKVATAPPRDCGAKKPAYSPLLLSASAWQKAQDEKKSKDAGRAGGLPASPKISCMGQVKGRAKRCSSARDPPARGSRHGGVVATLVLGLFGRRNGRTSRACSKVRDMPRGSSASATGSSHGSGRVAAAAGGVFELDPPLPVVRRTVRGDDAPSLWERRRGGGKALEGLQLPYIAAESS